MDNTNALVFLMVSSSTRLDIFKTTINFIKRGLDLGAEYLSRRNTRKTGKGKNAHEKKERPIRTEIISVNGTLVVPVFFTCNSDEVKSSSTTKMLLNCVKKNRTTSAYFK